MRLKGGKEKTFSREREWDMKRKLDFPALGGVGFFICLLVNGYEVVSWCEVRDGNNFS